MSAKNEMLQNYSRLFTEVDAKKFMKSKKHGNVLLEGFKVLYKALKSKNLNLSTSSKVMIAGALAYVIMPADLVFDYIPVAGMLDDISIISGVLHSVTKDLEEAA